MLEYVGFLSPYVVLLLTCFLAYFGLKRIEKRAIQLIYSIIEEKQGTIKPKLEEWLNSEAAQKALYQIGGMIGSGAMAGSGLQPKGGKMKFPDLVMQLASSFIQGRVPALSGQTDTSKALNAERLQNIPDAR